MTHRLTPVLTQNRLDGTIDILLSEDSREVKETKYDLVYGKGNYPGGMDVPEGCVKIGHLIGQDEQAFRKGYKADPRLVHYIADRLDQPPAYWTDVVAESPVWVALVSALPVGTSGFSVPYRRDHDADREVAGPFSSKHEAEMKVIELLDKGYVVDTIVVTH